MRFEAHHIHPDVVECREVVVGKFVKWRDRAAAGTQDELDVGGSKKRVVWVPRRCWGEVVG